MGFSLKKATKSISKVASKAVKSVGNVTKPIVNGVGKIASGKVGEGLGDIGSASARMGLDLATGGNTKVVDMYSGGLLTTAQNAARGNTSDIARLGITGGATVYGGPAAGLAVNSVYGQGGNATQAGLAGFSNGTFGGDMSFLSDAQGFLSGDSALSKLANNAIQGVSFSNKPKPMPAISAPSVISSYTPESDTKKYFMIGGGVIGLALIVFLIIKRRK